MVILKVGIELKNGLHELEHIVKTVWLMGEELQHLHSHNIAIPATENFTCWVYTMGIGCINVHFAINALNHLLCHGNVGLYLKKQVCNAKGKPLPKKTLQT